MNRQRSEEEAIALVEEGLKQALRRHLNRPLTKRTQFEIKQTIGNYLQDMLNLTSGDIVVVIENPEGGYQPFGFFYRGRRITIAELVRRSDKLEVWEGAQQSLFPEYTPDAKWAENPPNVPIGIAHGAALDLLASSTFGLHREFGEPDSVFRARILAPHTPAPIHSPKPPIQENIKSHWDSPKKAFFDPNAPARSPWPGKGRNW